MGAMEKEKLKIVMVTDVFDGAWGGGMISTERFVEELRSRHDVIVVSTGEKAPGKFIVPGTYTPVPFLRDLLKKMGFIFAYPRRKVLRQAFRGADVVHVQLPFLLGIGAISVAREMKIPVVSSYHVQPENILYNINIRSEMLASLVHRFFIRFFFSRTDLVFCPSEMGRRELVDAGLAVPAVVLSNGILPRFRKQYIPRPDSWNGYFVIYTVGRMAPEKRHDVIIHAVKKSRYRDRIMLVMSGKGPRENRIRRMVRRESIRFQMGYVPEVTLIRNYCTADLYVHASEVELESMSVLEAMGCGLPVLVADAPASAAKQFALDDRFVFKQGDADDLARHIDYFIDHRDELATASDAYREIADEYRIEKSIERLEGAYRGVIETAGQAVDAGEGNRVKAPAHSH